MTAEERLKELFSQALERKTPEEREEFLAEACQDQPELRSQVESLLRAHKQAGDFLGQTMKLPPADFELEPPGMMIGRYKLLEKIGEGGFGVVYMAEQQEPVQRKVALKIIKPGMDTREVIARFEAERQALALMEHPNIARVLDGGATQAGRPYFVMELVRGIPITDYCDQTKLSTTERLELFIKVCQAVQHAHQKAVIHRDLKPSNILVTLHDGEPVPKVIDFGVAKALGQKLTEKTLFTAFRQMIGTPAYMAPEQAEMSGVDIDTRSDIYSLGVLLYELLTSVTPFEKETLAKAALDEIRRMIRETEPPKPSTRLRTLGDKLVIIAKHRHTEPAALSRLVQGDLDWIVMKCLEKDRTRRYETVNGLARDIQRHLNDEPVMAAAPSAMYRARKFVRRHRPALGITGLATILFIAGAVSTIIEMLRADRYATQTQKTAAALAENLYVSDVNMAQHAIQAGDYGLAYRTLQSHRPMPGEPDKRGFEWRYFWRLCQDERLSSWPAHSNAVRCVAPSPDGLLLGSSSYDHESKLWDMQSGNCLMTFNQTDSLLFSPEGDLIFTAGTHGSVEIWNMRSLRKEFTFDTGGTPAAERPIVSLAVSPIGSILAVCPDGWFLGGRGSIWLYDYRKKRVLGQLPNSGDRSTFSRDGRVLVTGSAADRIHVWDVPSRTETKLLGPVGSLSSLALSPDGRLLATTEFWLASIRLWDLETGGELSPLQGHETLVWQVAFSPDGRLLASVSSDQTVRLWDIEKRHLVRRLVGHTSEVWSAAFSSDGQRLYTGGKDKIISVWPTSFPSPSNSFPVANTRPSPPLFSGDGSLIAAIGAEGETGGQLVVRAVKSLETLAVLKKERQALWFSKNSSELLTLSDGGELHLWSIAEPTLRRRITLPKDMGQVSRATASRDGHRVAALAEAKTGIWLMAVNSEQLEGTLDSGFKGEPWLAFSADSHLIAVAAGQVFEVWDLQSRRLLTRQTAHNDGISCVLFSPDGRLMATSSIDNTAKLWNVGSWQEIATLSGHREGVVRADFSPDGQTLATACGDGTVKLWHVRTHREIASLKPLTVTWHVGFSPDGRCLACAPGVGPLHLLRCPSLDEIETLERNRGHLITR